MNQQIVNALVELRQASLSAGLTQDPKPIMQRYNMLFLGEKLNIIYAIEFLAALNGYFGFVVDKDSLFRELPQICASLGMKCTPMAALSDISNPMPANFSIELH